MPHDEGGAGACLSWRLNRDQSKRKAIVPARDLYAAPLANITWDDVFAFLARGEPEGPRLDYKRELNDKVAKSIGAMANTRGGLILVGVDEDPKTKKPKQHVRGIGPQHTAGGTLTNLCRKQLSPGHVPESKVLEIPDSQDRFLLLIRVDGKKAPKPIYHEDGGVLVRVGDQNRPADLHELESLLARNRTEVIRVPVESRQPQERSIERRGTTDDSASLKARAALDAASLNLIGHASMANADGRVYTLVGVEYERSQPQDMFTDDERRLLIEATIRSLTQENPDITQSTGLVVIHGKEPHVRVVYDVAGVMTAQVGWRKYLPPREAWDGDPFPIVAAVVGLDMGIRLATDRAVISAFRPRATPKMTLGLTNWPKGGLSMEGLTSADGLSPKPLGSMQGFRCVRQYALDVEATKWRSLSQFLQYVVADAGFTNISSALSQPPDRERLCQVIKKLELSIP